MRADRAEGCGMGGTAGDIVSRADVNSFGDDALALAVDGTEAVAVAAAEAAVRISDSGLATGATRDDGLLRVNGGVITEQFFLINLSRMCRLLRRETNYGTTAARA